MTEVRRMVEVREGVRAGRVLDAGSVRPRAQATGGLLISRISLRFIAASNWL